MIHNHLPHRMYVHASPTVHANVAAMIHRHPAPARGWPRWMLRIRKSNEWPYGQWRQIAAATPGTSNSKPNVAAMTHRHPAPGGLAPLNVWNTNIQRVALRPMAAGCRRYIRYV